MAKSFYAGQWVKLTDGSTSELFEVVSWNDSENKGRIEDSEGRGWYVRSSQIEAVEPFDGENDEWDDSEYEDDDF